MRNYVIDTKLLPKVWLTWDSKKNGVFNKRYWLNCQTGKKKDTPESWMLYEGERSLGRYYREIPEGKIVYGINYYTHDKDKIWVAAGSNVRYAYAKYHEDIDRLEIAAVGISTKRSDESHKWYFLGDRFFIGKDKSILDKNGNKITSYFNLYKYHTATTAKEFVGMITRLNTSNSFVNEFRKFIGDVHFPIGNGTTIKIESPWHLQKWYMTSQNCANKGKGKQHKLVEELTSIPLSDTEGFGEKYPAKRSLHYHREMNGIVYFENVNSEWDVLRAFSRSYDNKIHEKWRVYIDKGNTTRIVSKTSNGWIPARQEHSYWSYYYLANAEEAIANCNRIKYIITSTDKIDDYHTVDFLVTALRFPEIEQIVKFGYADSISNVIRSHTPKADLKDMFGGYYIEKEKNVLRKVGMTKFQFDKYMNKNGYYKRNALRTMRQFFGNDLSPLDNSTFEKYFNACYEYTNCYIAPRFYACNNIDEFKFFKNIARLYEKNDRAFNLARDTISGYNYLQTDSRPEVDWYFDDMSDLVRAHDAITELRNIQEAERRAMYNLKEAERRKKEDEKRKKVDEKRKEYEYEDDKYIIRLPKDLNEIIREGNVQHICIGGYTSRHAMGDTNLFFLREKSNPDIPFYAIEMDRNKNIVQIHGSCNKWLGNNPEAIPTVIRWLRKNGISCSDKILTCKAKGYGSINDYVPMPVVD